MLLYMLYNQMYLICNEALLKWIRISFYPILSSEFGKDYDKDVVIWTWEAIHGCYGDK